MIRHSRDSRVLLNTCVYVFAGIATVVGAFCVAAAFMPTQSAASTIGLGDKIGPGYARMQPPNMGKPEKVRYWTPYYPHTATLTLSRTKKPKASTAPALLPSTPMVIAARAQSSFSHPEIGRIY